MTVRLTLLAILLVALAPGLGRAQTVADELDAYWAEVVRTIDEGDFAGYAALYDDDAVLVSLSQGSTYPIAQALAGWKQLFDDTRDGKAGAHAEFRFTRTLSDATTAHQTGIFRYEFHPESGEPAVNTMHFEMLFVKKGGWLGLMEFQKEPATDEEWAAAE